jgi:hypothetical protein
VRVHCCGMPFKRSPQVPLRIALFTGLLRRFRLAEVASHPMASHSYTPFPSG